MKRPVTKTILAIVGVALLAVLTAFVIWLVKPSQTLDIYILDKTVPTKERTEHQSLHWVLTHQKYVQQDQSFYQLKEDYYGFFPINPQQQEFDFKSISLREVETLSSAMDMAYYADTYGVYYNDWYTGKSPELNNKQKVYGGLNKNDFLLLKALKEKGKTIVTEFVLLDKSTSNLVRRKTEALLGIEWAGWIGRYFPSLDSSACPDWIVNRYQSQNQGQWSFSGAGVILIHKYGKILVLNEEEALKEPLPVIETQGGFASRFNLPRQITYSGWFDLTTADTTNQVPAHFHLKTTPQGDSLLESHRLESRFPAVVSHNSSYSFYYFAGDFSQNPVRPNTCYFQGIRLVDFLFYERDPNSTAHFFWKYYIPLVQGILEETHQQKAAVGPGKKSG